MDRVEHLELWERDTDELRGILIWNSHSGWSLTMLARQEGLTWSDSHGKVAYDHLTTGELLDILHPAIEKLRGF